MYVCTYMRTLPVSIKSSTEIAVAAGAQGGWALSLFLVEALSYGGPTHCK